MTSGRFHTWQSQRWALAAPATHRRSKCPRPEKGEGGLKYANPRDKYILILLEYKLMPQLSG